MTPRSFARTLRRPESGPPTRPIDTDHSFVIDGHIEPLTGEFLRQGSDERANASPGIGGEPECEPYVARGRGL